MNKKSLILLEQIIVSGSNFFLSIAIARILGVEALGQYAAFFIVLLSISSVVNAFFTSPLLSMYHQKPEDKASEYLRATNTNCLLFCAIATITITIIGCMLNFFDAYLSLTFSFGYLLIEYSRKVALLRDDLLSMLKMSSLSYLLSLMSIISISMFYPLTIELVLCIQSLLFLLSYIIYMFPCKKNNFTLKINELIYSARDNYFNGKWLFMTTFTQWFGEPFVMFSTGYILGPYKLGILRIVQNVVGLLSILAQLLDSYLVIYFSKARMVSKNGLELIINKINLSIIVLGIICIIIVGYIGYDVIKLMYGNVGDEYLIKFCLIVYILIYTVHFLVLVEKSWLKVTQNTRVLFYSSIYSMFTTLIFFYPIIIYYGVYGSVLMILSNWIVLAFILFWKRER